MLAETVDIEIAAFGGSISSPGMNNFTYKSNFRTIADNYTLPLTYISNTTKNGNDPLTGAQILGFKWWNFAFPTLVDSGTNAIPAAAKVRKGQSVVECIHTLRTIADQ